MWSLKIVTVILIFCVVDGFALAAITSNKMKIESNLAEFIGPWEDMSHAIVINKTDESYLAAKWLLGVEWSKIKEGCSNSKKLQLNMKLYQEEFEEFMLSRQIPSSLTVSEALKLRKILVDFFSDLVYCPEFHFSDNMKVSFNMEAIVSKEIIRRIKIWVRLIQRTKNTANVEFTECWRNIQSVDETLAQEVMSFLSPIPGNCYENLQTRKCFMNAVKNYPENIRRKFKIYFSPPDVHPYCKNLDKM